MNEPKPSPKDENARIAMSEIAAEVDERLPDGWQFIVLSFPPPDSDGMLNFISNTSPNHSRNILLEAASRIKPEDFEPIDPNTTAPTC